jgi:hypothetical protein
LALTVHKRIDQAHDRYQHHAEEQGVDPAIVSFARWGFEHGQRLKKDCWVAAAGGGQRKNSPDSHLASRVTRADYLHNILQRNATSVTHRMVTGRKNRCREGAHRGVTSGRNEAYLSLAPLDSMMQNRKSRFRVGASTDLWVVDRWESLDCFFGKLGLTKPSVLSERAAVRGFSILAGWRECIRQCCNFVLLVRPILCAGSAEGHPLGSWVGFGGEWVRVLKTSGMNGGGKAVAGCEVACEQ